MAVCSFIFMPMVLLASAVLLTGGQTTMRTPPTTEPYVVAIHKSNATRNTVVCSGAIVKPKYILTTATCIDRAGSDIVVSTDATNSNQTGRTVYEVDKVIKHQKFNSTLNTIDLALIKLKKEIQMIKDLVSPIMVTNVGPMNGSACAGTYWPLKPPLTLMTYKGVQTPCADAATPTKVCANFTEQQQCMSDFEGGVLACNGKLIGIFSKKTDEKDCTSERLGFVDVTRHYDWINMPEMLRPMGGSAGSGRSAGSEVSSHSLYHVAIATALGVLFHRL